MVREEQTERLAAFSQEQDAKHERLLTLIQSLEKQQIADPPPKPATPQRPTKKIKDRDEQATPERHNLTLPLPRPPTSQPMDIERKLAR